MLILHPLILGISRTGFTPLLSRFEVAHYVFKFIDRCSYALVSSVLRPLFQNMQGIIYFIGFIENHV